MMANIPNEISEENNDPEEYGSGEEDVETAIQFPDDAELTADLMDMYEEMYDYLTENYGDASVEAPNYDNMDINDEINVRVPGKKAEKNVLRKVRLWINCFVFFPYTTGNKNFTVNETASSRNGQVNQSINLKINVILQNDGKNNRGGDDDRSRESLEDYEDTLPKASTTPTVTITPSGDGKKVLDLGKL